MNASSDGQACLIGNRSGSRRAATADPISLCTQVLWGLGWAFSGGADVAWLADELRQFSEDDFTPVRGRRLAESLLAIRRGNAMARVGSRRALECRGRLAGAGAPGV
jgi:hypothetical protein